MTMIILPEENPDRVYWELLSAKRRENIIVRHLNNEYYLYSQSDLEQVRNMVSQTGLPTATYYLGGWPSNRTGQYPVSRKTIFSQFPLQIATAVEYEFRYYLTSPSRLSIPSKIYIPFPSPIEEFQRKMILFLLTKYDSRFPSIPELIESGWISETEILAHVGAISAYTRISEHNNRIESLQLDLTSLNEQLESTYRQLRELMSVNIAPSVKTDVKKQIEALNQLPFVKMAKLVYATDGSPAFGLPSLYILLNDYTYKIGSCEIPGGKLIIKIDLSTGTIKVEGANTLGVSGHSQHPHINSNQKVCWGGFGSLVLEYFKDFKYADGIAVFDAWRKAIEPGSYYTYPSNVLLGMGIEPINLYDNQRLDDWYNPGLIQQQMGQVSESNIHVPTVQEQEDVEVEIEDIIPEGEPNANNNQG